MAPPPPKPPSTSLAPSKRRAALWVVPSGVAIAAAVLGSVYALVTAFVALYPVPMRREAPSALVDGFGWAVGNWGTPLFLMLATAVLVYLSARHPGDVPLGGGVPVGLAGSLATAVLVYGAFDGLLWWEAPVYVAVGLAGALGGAASARRSRGHEAAFGLAGQLAAAAKPADLAAAVGLALAPVGAVRVALSSFGDSRVSAAPGGRVFEWEAQAPRGAEPGNRVSASPPASPLPEMPGRGGVPGIVRPPELQGPDREAWAAIGARAALSLPLSSATGEPVGHLAVFFRRRLLRGPLPRSAFSAGPRDLAATAGLALHNMVLTERAAAESATRERKRYELDIHDTIVQDFANIIMRLETVDPEPLEGRDRRSVRLALRLACSGIRQARLLVGGASELEAGTLGELVENAGRRCAEESGAHVSVSVAGSARRLETDTEVALLRVTQEALNNVAKHSAASEVEVSLTYATDSVVVHIRDNGRGFDPSSRVPEQSSRRPARPAFAGGRGLGGMRERLASVGGSLHVASAPGSGTRVLAEVSAERAVGVAKERARV